MLIRLRVRTEYNLTVKRVIDYFSSCLETYFPGIGGGGTTNKLALLPTEATENI